ncbi:MAG: PIN domain-containing protein [Candidatus Brocadiia bacterium]
MALWVFRTLFILASAGTAYSIGLHVGSPFICLLVGIVVSFGVIVAEWFVSKGPIYLISSIVFGALLGLLFATLTVQVLGLAMRKETFDLIRTDLTGSLIVLYTYLGVVFIYESRDRFNLIVPYVEFRREEKGIRPVVLDTSVIIDGRLPEILGARALEGPFIVPQVILHELHKVADADDKLKRERGRLGLDTLSRIQENPDLDVRVQELASDHRQPVDEQLIRIAKMVNGRLATNDYNLNRLASLDGVDVINFNELANALKPVALPGEHIRVQLLKPGEQAGQAVGFLPDGTMVIVEDAVHMLDEEVEVEVRNTITRETGRMIFARPAEQRIP